MRAVRIVHIESRPPAHRLQVSLVKDKGPALTEADLVTLVEDEKVIHSMAVRCNMSISFSFEYALERGGVGQGRRWCQRRSEACSEALRAASPR